MTEVAVSCEGKRNDAGETLAWPNDDQRANADRVERHAMEPALGPNGRGFEGGKLTIKCRCTL